MWLSGIINTDLKSVTLLGLLAGGHVDNSPMRVDLHSHTAHSISTCQTNVSMFLKASDCTLNALPELRLSLLTQRRGQDKWFQFES